MLNFNNLDALNPTPVEVVVRGRKLHISEITVGQTKAAMSHLRMIYGLFEILGEAANTLPSLDDEEALMAFISGLDKELMLGASQVVLTSGVASLAIFLDAEPEWVESLNWAEIGVLAFMVVKRNFDFFATWRKQLTLSADDKALLKALVANSPNTTA